MYINEISINELISFDDTCEGDFFKFGKKYYIKIRPVSNSVCDFNCYNLTDGCLDFISDENIEVLAIPDSNIDITVHLESKKNIEP